MKHYRQIIVNVAVEDDTKEEVLEKLVQKVKKDIETNIEEKTVQIVGIRVN